MVVCFVVANTMTNAGNVILIQFAAPVYVAIFGFSFLGEKSTKTDWLAIIIILMGLGCFFLDDLSFEFNDVSVFIDSESFLYLKGTKVDFELDGVNEGIKFHNPNVKAVCGCGESFEVKI